MNKSELRKKIRVSIESVDRGRESVEICAKLRGVIPSHGGILAFLPLKDEPDISPIIDDLRNCGRLVLVAGERSAPCLEPADVPIALALVPGRAFDGMGRRLGRGGGTFDRMLAGLSCRKVGVAFECQIVDEIPSEEHDVRMDEVVTGAESP